MIAIRRQSNPVISFAALWRQRASSLLATNLLSVPKVLAFPENQINGTTVCSFLILAALAQQNLCEIHPWFVFCCCCFKYLFSYLLGCAGS